MAQEAGGSRLLQVVEGLAISPGDAMSMAEQYLSQSKGLYPNDSEHQHQLRAADKIIGRYSKLAMTVGAATALPGAIPGLGTAVAVVGGATADTAMCMKLQVDMCMCLASVFKYDIKSEDGRHLSFLIAATGSLQQSGVRYGAQVGSKAGVKMLNQYLKGPALQAVTQAFRRVGIPFTRKAAAKAIPFGVGAVVSSGASYALTRYVGREAKQWFIIDSSPTEGPTDTTATVGPSPT